MDKHCWKFYITIHFCILGLPIHLIYDGKNTPSFLYLFMFTNKSVPKSILPYIDVPTLFRLSATELVCVIQVSARRVVTTSTTS